MKKNLRYFMTLLLMMVASVGWSETATLPNTQALTIGAAYVGEDTHIKIKTSSANTYTNPLRFYANVTVTIQADEGYVISSVTYEASQTGNYVTYAKEATVTPKVTPTVNGKNVTWALENVSEFTFKPSAQTRANSITITYTSAGSTPTCAKPTFSPAGGTYPTAQNVTISTTTEDATIYYTIDGSTPTTSSKVYSSAINVSENTTIKAFAAKNGYNTSEVAEATYTIKQPNSISEVRALNIDDVVFTQGIVTSCVGKTAYIQDDAAAICVYGNGNLNLTVGDKISVEGTLSTFNGLLEITSPEVVVQSSGNTVEPEVMTIADILGENAKQGWLVKIENATVTAINDQNTTIAQGENTIVVRNISDVEVAVNDIITLVGNIGCHNGAQIANPSDVTIVSGTPNINADNVELAYNATSGEIAYTIKNAVSGVSLSASTKADWISNFKVESDKVTFTTTPNEGTEPRTATVTLSYGTVTKDVTVTQAHQVKDFATLPFEFDKGKGDIEKTDGLTQEGLGTDYSSSPKLKFDGTGDYMILKINEAPSVLTFDIKGNSFSGGTFNVQTSADGETWTDLQTYTKLGDTQSETFDNLSNDTRYIKWIYTEKVSGNVALGNIKVSKPVKITTAASGYTTLVSGEALDIVNLPDGLTAYYVTADGVSTEKVTLTKVTAAVPAETPLIFKGAVSTPYEIPIATSGTALSDNQLAGSSTDPHTFQNDGDAYILSGGEFHPTRAGEFPAGKAYLNVSATNAKALTISFAETNGINNVNVENNTNEKIFNLAGQQMKSAVKGVYIKNGKKYIK